MWGILQSSQTIGVFGPEGDHDDESEAEESFNDDIQKHDHSNDIESGSIPLVNASYEVSDPAGPATFWGILQCSQYKDDSDNSVPASEGLSPGGDFIEDSIDPDSEVQGPGPQDPTTLEPAAEIVNNDDYVLGEADTGEEGAGPVLHANGLRSDQSESSVKIEEDAIDGGDDRSGVAVSIHDEAADIAEEGVPGPANLWGISESDREHSGDNSNGEGSSEQTGGGGNTPVTHSGSNRSTDNQGQVEAGSLDQSHDGSSPEILYNVNDHYEIDNDQEEQAAMPSTSAKTSTSEANINISSHEASDGNIEEEGTMSSENIVENEMDTSNPRMEPNFGSADGDSNANSKETLATATDVVSLTEVARDRERALEKKVTKTEASRAASKTTASQNLAGGNHGSFYIRFRDVIYGETLQTGDHAGTPASPARAHSLPEPEVFDFPGPVPKPKSDPKAEKKKAEHKRYKAKKKAEAAAKRQVEKEVAEEVAEASEPPKSPAELQAEEDANLGEKRMKLQAERQEKAEKAATLLSWK